MCWVHVSWDDRSRYSQCNNVNQNNKHIAIILYSRQQHNASTIDIRLRETAWVAEC